ncbi:Aspartate--tRNA ligase, cytoplasmic, partial [Fusarium oxysporum f. sp. albedinis]
MPQTPYTEDDVIEAMLDVTDNGLWQHETAQKHGMPQTTLSDRLRGIPPKPEVIHPDQLLSKSQDIACTDGQPRSNEHLIFYLKERRESDAACDLEFMATVKLFTMVVILALDTRDQVGNLDTPARGPGLCSVPQSSPCHRRCPPTTTRQGTAYRCTLASQVHETPSVHKDEDRETPGGIEVQLFYPDRR